MCSVKYVLHKAYTKTFSMIVCLKWYFQMTLMTDLYFSLDISMRYFPGGRLDMKVNFTLHASKNVVYNFREEYQKMTMVDS